MPKKQHYVIKRDVEDNYSQEFRTYHRCGAYRRGGPEDVLSFWPFAGGSGLPYGIPFDVTSSDPCPCCKEYVTASFEWKGSLLWTPP